jgi:hypothetical protein
MLSDNSAADRGNLCNTDEVNIVLKAFDGEYCKPIIERAFRDMELGTCICVMNDKTEWPDLKAREQIWLSAKLLRAGQYPDVDWSKILPLDASIIESMRHCEAVFLRMVERYARSREMPYMERKRQYLDHLRFWNDVLETKKIDLVVMNSSPHQCYDFVLYDLCKLKDIPTLHVERAAIMDAFYMIRDWEKSGDQILVAQERLIKEYQAKNDIPLSPAYESYFESFVNKSEIPWYQKKAVRPRMERGFVQRWAVVVFRMLLRKPFTVLRALLSPEVWARKLRQHRISKLYERNVRDPDLTRPYIYVALHYQPEATTCPMGGAYVDQEVMVQLLAACVPEGIQLYVKEHPFQGEICRSEEFYRSMLQIPSVTFVPKSLDTFSLTQHSLAVATITGIAGFEALFKGKPVLMFGHRFFQYAPGVHTIRTADDCRKALTEILEGRGRASPRDLRIFLKAMEETATPYVGPHATPYTYTYEEKAQMMGERIEQDIRLLHLA